TLSTASGRKQCYVCSSATDSDCGDKFKPRDAWKIDVNDNDSCIKGKVGNVVTRLWGPICVAQKDVNWCCNGNLCNAASIVSAQILMKWIGLLSVLYIIRRY
ncbi:unnamed protein product, partial [Didymodactylos carnosus]